MVGGRLEGRVEKLFLIQYTGDVLVSDDPLHPVGY